MGMFELLLQTFWEKNLIKSLLISTLDMVIYYNGTFTGLSAVHKRRRRRGTFLEGSTKPLFTSQNRTR
jgi:hypothetical protein